MKLSFVLFIGLILLGFNLNGAVKPSKVFADHMVLQRNINAPIWGTANPNEKITISVGSKEANGVANEKGEWNIKLPKFKAGGPYELSVTGESNTVVFKNVMFGEVWFASGQSNMMFSMAKVAPNGDKDISEANYKNIRLFHHPKTVEQFPSRKIGGGTWAECTPESVKEFSAVAYYFARELHENYDVPVGIILSGWGGTQAEAWCRYDVLKTIDPYKEQASKLQTGEENWINEYEPMPVHKARNKEIIIKSFKGIDEGVTSFNYDDSDWGNVDLKKWNIKSTNVIWLRKQFELTEGQVNEALTMYLGKPKSRVNVYVNGEMVFKALGKEISFDIPQEVLKEGNNIVSMRLADGGLKPRVTAKTNPCIKSGNQLSHSLSGNWKFSDSIEPDIMPYTKYYRIIGSLYGGMINPFVGYGIKGVIWYQGEANSTIPMLYNEVFSKMIIDWREQWGQGEFPFLYVQLPNYIDAKAKKGQYSSWPLLREAQMKTLEVPNTGMAIAIDLGDSTDIHPKNKYPVGVRLSKIARHLVYGEKIVYTGPTMHSVSFKGAKGIVDYNHIGSGLETQKGKELRGFEIAGKDKKFYTATAIISKDKVLISSSKVKKPVSVRYNWDDNPSGNLYNKEGFTAAPFRSDNWNE